MRTVAATPVFTALCHCKTAWCSKQVYRQRGTHSCHWQQRLWRRRLRATSKLGYKTHMMSIIQMIHANAFQTCRLQEGNKCFGEEQSALVQIVSFQSLEIVWTAWVNRWIYDEYNLWHHNLVMNSSGAGPDTLGHFLELFWALVSTQSRLQIEPPHAF